MILRDPVHGLISFEGASEAVVGRLIDTPEVQRLRRIRALGLASLAFPGAEHSRFAHAVGAAHVMRRYLGRVASLSDHLPVADRIGDGDAAVALAAAILHDVGHGPLSHTFEGVSPGAPSHEEWTSRIVLDPDSSVHAVLREIDPEAPVLTERLVHGESRIPHLARAVSGTFDVDRCDYLARDSHMTGVRYGLLDLDWLLRSLRLYAAAPGQPVRLAVDGAKGLTAVEGFFLARLYMYRQVYLHKAVRAAEVVMTALFRRLAEVESPPGVPAALSALVRGGSPSTADYLSLDDHELAHALVCLADGTDPILADLARRLRDRRLLKTLDLRPDVDGEEARGRLREVVQRAGLAADHLATIDRVSVEAWVEDESLVVVHGGGRVERLLDASPVLRGLSRERFVHQRAVFPAETRDAVARALADLT